VKTKASEDAKNKNQYKKETGDKCEKDKNQNRLTAANQLILCLERCSTSQSITCKKKTVLLFCIADI